MLQHSFNLCFSYLFYKNAINRISDVFERLGFFQMNFAARPYGFQSLRITTGFDLYVRIGLIYVCGLVVLILAWHVTVIPSLSQYLCGPQLCL